MPRMDRRQFIGRALALGTTTAALGRIPQAAAQARTKLTIISHRVHQQTSTDGPAGDVTKAWSDQNGVNLEWVTLDLNAIHDRVFREAGLGGSEVAVAFVLNTRAVPEGLARNVRCSTRCARPSLPGGSSEDPVPTASTTDTSRW